MEKILTDFKQQQVIAIMAIGGTRTLAAQLVGCHPRTIQNLVKVNAKFAEELNHAETCPEYQMLKTINGAGRQIVHAAKWGLERIYPDRYRPRQPATFSVDAVKQLLIELTARLAGQAVSTDERRRILETMAQFGKEMIVNTQPFVEDAIPLLAELTALTIELPPIPQVEPGELPSSCSESSNTESSTSSSSDAALCPGPEIVSLAGPADDAELPPTDTPPSLTAQETEAAACNQENSDVQ